MASNWDTLIEIASKEKGIRKSICVGCGWMKLYDSNNKEYIIWRDRTVADLEKVINDIREVNAGALIK
jgi:hypothetical protein